MKRNISSIPLKNKWDYLKTNLKIKEISFNEYTDIYANQIFSNYSHIQTPGYYLEEDDVMYLKLVVNKKIIAIFTLLNKRFFNNIIYIVRLNNGPLITKEFVIYKNYILKSILYLIKSKFTKFISFAPSSLYTEKKYLNSFNIIKLKFPPMNTFLIDLKNTTEDIHKNLKKNWRNGLKKGLKHTKVIQINNQSEIKEILLDYKNYSRDIGFKSISIEKCDKWFQNSILNKKLLYLKVYKAFKSNNPNQSLGSIGILCFKNRALYLFGFTSSDGKKYQANVALLWEAIIDLKNNNFKKFDLGGFNKRTPKGIIKFKEGLNGLLEETLGEYFYFGIF